MSTLSHVKQGLVWEGFKSASFVKPCQTKGKTEMWLILLFYVFLFNVGVRRSDVWRLGSAPVEFLYNWALTCLSLIELAKKLQCSRTLMTPQTSGVVLHSPPPSLQTSEILDNITISSINVL